MNVLYCDNHLLIVDKPAGLLTQDSGTGQPNLEDQAKAWLKREFKKPGNVFLHTVHRLDRPVSGVVLFARTSKALTRLNAQMRSKQGIVKIYRAWVEGQMPEQQGTLNSWLVHGDRQAQVVSSDTEGAKRAILEYRVLKQEQGRSLVEINLITGRYHQIRVQLAEVGCPILGDDKYGSNAAWSRGIALCHVALECMHPVSGAPVRCQSNNLLFV